MSMGRTFMATFCFAAAATTAEGIALVWLNHASTPIATPSPRRHAIQMKAPVVAPPPSRFQPKVETLDLVASPLAPPSALPPPPMARRALARPSALGFDLPALGAGGLVLSGARPDNQTRAVASAPSTGPTRAARPKRRPPPRYPPRAAARRIEGEVVLRVAIDANGRVTSAEVVGASPRGVFDAAAVAAARRYRFDPALKNGVPTPVILEQRILFRVPK